MPIGGRGTARLCPVGSHSQTRPPSTSSQDSQVPHGVPPPEQLRLVPERIRYASRTLPSRPKRIADAPPFSKVSALDTSTQPPSAAGNVAIPSDARCHW